MLNEIKSWGIAVVRTELKEIDPPKDVQETMNKVVKAEGASHAIKLVNEAANRYFIGNEQLLKRLQTVEESLKNKAKIVLPASSELVNVIGELAGVLPLKPREHKPD